jgi:SAM-dependent methyltransferase
MSSELLSFGNEAVATMELNYLRLKIFAALLQPFSRWTRKKRMDSFLSVMGPAARTSILDLGGQPKFWDAVPFPLRLTILNLPGTVNPIESNHHDIHYVEGDACNVDAIGDGSFEIVFSNSVIEHVGPSNKQASFAHEVRRLGRSYWVQTPSKWFPVEAHSGMPFWWFYPDKVRRFFIDRWHKTLPGNPWTQMIEETSVLSKDQMAHLFPEATILVETFLGIPKSYIAYHRHPNLP